MNRSNYTDDCDMDPLDLGRWRAQVASAIRGRRGQDFLRELAAAMDAMPEKVLIANELIDEEGDCCTIGVVCKARGIDVSAIDIECPDGVGEAVGISHQLVAEIEFLNDYRPNEDPKSRWTRMRKWVESKIMKDSVT